MPITGKSLTCRGDSKSLAAAGAEQSALPSIGGGCCYRCSTESLNLGTAAVAMAWGLCYCGCTTPQGVSWCPL